MFSCFLIDSLKIVSYIITDNKNTYSKDNDNDDDKNKIIILLIITRIIKNIFYKSWNSTFGKHLLIILTYCNGPKVGNKQWYLMSEYYISLLLQQWSIPAQFLNS